MRRLKQHREGISDCALAVLFLSTGRIWNSKRYNLLRGFNGRFSPILPQIFGKNRKLEPEELQKHFD